MEDQIRASSWALGLVGALSVIFGVLIIAWPDITLKVFLILLGIHLLAAGAVALIGAIVNRQGHWVAGMLFGAISVIAGLYVFANPQISALVVLTLISLWAIVQGVVMFISGFQVEEDGIWLTLAGLVSLLFGIYIFVEPREGALALVWLIGIYAVVNGILLGIGAFKLNEAGDKVAKSTS